MEDKDRKYIDAAWKMVAETLKKQGEVQMMAIMIQRKTGKITMMPATGIASKAIFAKLMGFAIKKFEADMVVHVSEAWMLDIQWPNDPEERKEKQKEIARLDKVGLSDHPDRKEVLIVSFKTADGEEGYEIKQLMRDKEYPYAGESIFNNEIGQMSSRFFDGLWSQTTEPGSPTIH